MIRSAKYSLIFKTALFCTALFALWLWCGSGGCFSADSCRQFSVILSILTAVYYLFALIAHTEKGLAVWFPSFKLAVMLSGVLTWAVALFMLPGQTDDLSAMQADVRLLMCWVLPIGMVLDWLLFDPHGVLRMIDPVLALIPPAAYTLAVWYGDRIGLHWGTPYWFMDRAQLGASNAWLIVLGLGGGLLLVGSIVYVLDHLLEHAGKKKKK